MSDDHAARLWFATATAAGMAAAPGLLAGGFPLLPLFMAVVGLACAAHRPSRVFVTDKLAEAFAHRAVDGLHRTLPALALLRLTRERRAVEGEHFGVDIGR